MLEISINIDTGAGFARLQKLFEDKTPFYRDISATLKAASNRAFRDHVDPVTGEAWEELSPVTVARRGSSKRILTVTQALDNSVEPGYNNDSAWISSNSAYATTHYFGALKGSFGYKSGGTTKRGKPGKVRLLPWGDIPARPFMGLGQEDKDDILDFISTRIKSIV